METSSNNRQTKDYKRAAAANCRFGIDSTHYGSTAFMSNRPIYSRELAPKQHLHLDLKQYVRTMPTLQPIFGHFDAHITAFYVPYAMIWSRFNQFITQAIRDGVKPAKVPTINSYVLYRAIRETLGTTLSVGGVDVGTATACDYHFIDYNNATAVSQIQDIYMTTNSTGARNIMASLSALGYQCPACMHFDGASSTGTNSLIPTSEIIEMSALPLLCWTKVWYDYFRIPDADSFPFEPDKVTGSLSISQVKAILNRMAFNPISYPKTYFAHQETADASGTTNFRATTSSNKPTLFFDGRTQNTTEQNIQHAEVGGTQVESQLMGTNVSIGNVPNTNGVSPHNALSVSAGVVSHGAITDLALNQLSRVTDYVKRISIAGFNTIKRYLAEYGVTCDEDYVLKTAEYIADFTFPLGVQETTCLDSSNLGAQCGASIKGSGNMTIDYSAVEYGLLIVYMNIRPKVEFLYGMPRHISMHLKPFDFYHPDFDGFGYQATASSEMHIRRDPSRASHSNLPSAPTVTIGVLPVYAEYKTGFSLASGSFARWTKRNSMDKYHCARIIDESTSSYVTSASLLSLSNGIGSPADYLRIFGNYNDDPFTFHFDFIGYIDAPMKPLFDLPGEWSANSTVSGKMNDSKLHM